MDPTEHVQEHLQHTVAHGDHDEHGGGEHGGHGDHGHGHSSRWITAAALTAAILAAFAAVSGSLATRHLTESTLIRIAANDDWNYYQAKSIKLSILDAKTYQATLEKAQPRKKDLDKMAEYNDPENKDSLPRIQVRANGEQDLSKKHLETHETYEFAETMFHISIAIVAIAVVAKRRSFWYVSMVFGSVGVIAFGMAFAHAPLPEKEEEAPATASAPAVPGGEAGAAKHASLESAASHPAASEPAEVPH